MLEHGPNFLLEHDRVHHYSVTVPRLWLRHTPRLLACSKSWALSQRVPDGSTPVLNLYVNWRITNDYRKFSNALNVLLASSHIVLSLCKYVFLFFPPLLQLLFSCGGASV